MNKVTIATIAIGLLTLTAFKPEANKLVSKDAHISFYSHTPIEDITANNYKVVSTLDTSNGEVVFSVPMQSFEFEKALMQKHYNSNKFLDTKKFPKAKFMGKITDTSNIDFATNGIYEITIAGQMEIKGEAKPANEKATLTVQGNQVTLDAKMDIILGDFGITFSGGKPSTNIAKSVEVTVKAIYKSE